MPTGLGLSVTPTGNSESPLLPPVLPTPQPATANPSVCKTISKIDLPSSLFLPPPPPLPWAEPHPLHLPVCRDLLTGLPAPIPVLSCSFSPEPHSCLSNHLKMCIWLCHRALKIQPKLSCLCLHTHPASHPRPRHWQTFPSSVSFLLWDFPCVNSLI